MDILITPVFDRPLFSPDIIILFEDLDTSRLTFLGVRQGIFWKSFVYL